MKFFKSKSSGIKIGADTGRERFIGSVKRVIASFNIGSRVRYMVEHQEATRLETIVIGYGFDDLAVFQKQDIRFSDNELSLVTEDGVATAAECTTFSILVPSDIGEERKLDYQTRASLGRRGPFGVGKTITLMSLNPSRENLKLNATVRRNVLIREGLHAGHTMAVLDIEMPSIEAFESRAHTRVDINVAATVELVGKERRHAAYVLDVSERALRLVLDPPDTPCPAFKLKTTLSISLQLSTERPAIVLMGEIIQQRQREHVVKINKIQRRGQFVDFETLDAMELKIALLDLSGHGHQLN